MSCIFCRIIAGEVPCYKIWEDDEFLAFLDVNPINEGHTLLIPKSHTDEVFDMPAREYTDIFARAKLIAPIIKATMHAKRVGLVVEGFGVPHVHLHLVPISKGNELNPEHAKAASADALRSTQQKILGAMQ
jgi:histidine triad (HIT) family protein